MARSILASLSLLCSLLSQLLLLAFHGLACQHVAYREDPILPTLTPRTGNYTGPVKQALGSPVPSPPLSHLPVVVISGGSVLEGSMAAGSTDKLLQHVAIQLPEGRGLGHLSHMVHTELEAETFQVLCIVAHGGSQQREGVVHGDASLDDVLTQALQAVLAVGRGQVQQTNSVLRRQVYGVGVEELQEGAVDGVGELVDLNHLLHVLVPVGLKHGAEVFTSDLEHRLVDVDVFAFDAELEVGCLRAVKFLL